MRKIFNGILIMQKKSILFIVLGLFVLSVFQT